MIKLYITKLRELTEEEKKNIAMSDRDYRNYTRTQLENPHNQVTENMLEVVLTEEQFNAIRKAVIEKF